MTDSNGRSRNSGKLRRTGAEVWLPAVRRGLGERGELSSRDLHRAQQKTHGPETVGSRRKGGTIRRLRRIWVIGINSS